MASGEIDPLKPEKAAKLRAQIDTLQAEKAAKMAAIQGIEAKIQDILKGPKGANLHEMNLKILNDLQAEKQPHEQAYKDLAMQIARKKVELEDLSN